MLINRIRNIITSGSERSVIVKKNAVSALLIKIASMGVDFAKVPIMLSYLDSERYGLYVTIASIVYWTHNFDFGLGAGLRYKLTASVSQSDKQYGKKLVSTAYCSMSVIMGVLLLVLLPIIGILDWNKLLNTSAVANTELIICVSVTLLVFVVQFILELITYVLQAYQKAALSSLFKPLANLATLLAKIRTSDRVSDFVKQMTDDEILEYYSLVGEDRYMTNLGVLWLGTQPQRARLLYSPTVQFIRYDVSGNKVFKQVWDDYSLNPDELLENIWSSIPDWRESNEISDGLWRKDIPAYDEKVVREVLCNSIAHRPYTTRGDIFINIYPDRMAVVNPGRLPLGVTPNNILRTTVKRNKELSRLLYALHIMEGEGSGYDLMYVTQLSLGKTLPIVSEGEDSVSVTLERKIVSKEASRIYEYMQFAYPKIIECQKAVIAFGLILQDEIISAEDLSKKLQLPQTEGRLRSYVEILCSNEIVLTRGRGRGTRYYINPKIISNSKANILTTLKTIEPYRLRELILQDLKYHPKSLISDMSTRLPDIPFSDLQKWVRRMAANGELKHDGGRKYRHYSLP